MDDQEANPAGNHDDAGADDAGAQTGGAAG